MGISDEFRRALEMQLNPATRNRAQRPISVKSAEELEHFSVMAKFTPHEPDEQGITARVFGVQLDTGGAWNKADLAHAMFEELHVVLYVEGYAVIAVNLSELLSWGAAYAPLLRKQEREWEESRPTRAGSVMHKLVARGVVPARTGLKQWEKARDVVCEHIDGPGSWWARAGRIREDLRREEIINASRYLKGVQDIMVALTEVNNEASEEN